MAVTQGVALAWGASVGTASAVGTITTQGETFKYEADSTELKNSVGRVISKYWTNYRKTLSLKCVNSDSTTMDSTPQPGAVCVVTVISGQGDSEVADDDYIVESCTKERTIDGIGSFSVDLVAYDDIDAS
tara:strand:- start:214 stop:603 length:390 start_codon:yes stop_codon:yes gene_type:complete